MAGITLDFSDRLKISVRALRAMGPRCFKDVGYTNTFYGGISKYIGVYL